jgi:hypothetical protein
MDLVLVESAATPMPRITANATLNCHVFMILSSQVIEVIWRTGTQSRFADASAQSPTEASERIHDGVVEFFGRISV